MGTLVIEASHLHVPPFVSAFSAVLFSALSFCRISSDLVFLGWEGRPHFPHFPCIGFESLISKIRPTGFRMTGLR